MKLSIIVPVFNEEETIENFILKTETVIKKEFHDYEIIFVLDPSNDNTEQIITKNCKKNSKIKLIKLSRRFGQPAATFAGLNNVTGDLICIMDVDLQDPPEKIIDMKKLMTSEGSDIVLARRKSKIGENILRKFIANIGYFFIEKLSDTRIPSNVGEFRLFNKKVLTHIIKLKEKEFFLRGATAFVGFKTSIITFDRVSREGGITKYNKYTGSLKIGLDGVFLYSTKPLHFITVFSTISFIFSSVIFLLYSVLTFFNFFVFKYQFFIIVLILLVASLIFFSQGIVAEYIARIFSDIKQRPIYIIDKKINFDE